MSYVIRPLNEADDAEMEALEALLRASDDEMLGGHEVRAVQQAREGLADNEFRRIRYFVADHRSEGIVACAFTRATLVENTDRLLFFLVVSAQHRGRGVGTKLADAAVALARNLGRPTLAMSAALPATCDPHDPDLPSTRIATRLGLSPVALDIARAAPLPLTESVREAAERQVASRSGEYVMECWRDRTPSNRIDDMVAMLNQFAADEPLEDKATQPTAWTRQRLANAEQWALNVGRTSLTVAAVDREGRLVGFSEVQRSRAPGSTIAWQRDTVVLPAHRGHGLGLRMKLATHRDLASSGVQSVVTWNSQANPYMIGINETLGYRIVSREVGYRGSSFPLTTRERRHGLVLLSGPPGHIITDETVAAALDEE